MTSAEVQDLFGESSCYVCYGVSGTKALELVLLAQWVTAEDPGDDTSAPGLMDDASCFACFGGGSMGDLFELALLSKLVGPLCPAFAWGDATINQIPGSPSTTATFTPELDSGNIAVATTIDTVGGSAFAENIATATWNSTSEAPANMHIVSDLDAGLDGTVTWEVVVEVTAPGASILVSENQGTLGPSGTFDVPFTLPNTGGADWTLQWTQSAFAGSVSSGANAICEATFSCD